MLVIASRGSFSLWSQRWEILCVHIHRRLHRSKCSFGVKCRIPSINTGILTYMSNLVEIRVCWRFGTTEGRRIICVARKLCPTTRYVVYKFTFLNAYAVWQDPKPAYRSLQEQRALHHFKRQTQERWILDAACWIWRLVRRKQWSKRGKTVKFRQRWTQWRPKKRVGANGAFGEL